jgi:hypothetical protein
LIIGGTASLVAYFVGYGLKILIQWYYVYQISIFVETGILV